MKKNKLILLRHGESKWNLENRFTGWTDVDLTKNGIKEAENAGKLLLSGNYSADIVFTSVLKRAIRTTEICLNQLKFDKSKVIYDWRLNERHYGALQGLNKQETAKKYGDDQVHIWRRSYNVPPPKMDYSDERHPINDILYKNIKSNILPSSESLKDTLNRLKPLWFEEIIPLLNIGKPIMIVAHGNSLRAMVKILAKISNKDIIDLNIPTGIPLIYELDSNINILDNYFLGNNDYINEKTDFLIRQGKA